MPTDRDSLDSFLEYAPLPIAILDDQFRFVRVNRAMTEAHKIPSDASVGKEFAEVAPHLFAVLQPILARVLATGEPIQADIGGERHCWTVCFPMGASRVAFMVLEPKEWRVDRALHRMNELLRHWAFRDPLTNLYNRRFFQEALDLELRRAARKQLPVGLVLLDVDRFKAYNDDFGHAAGDAILRAVAAELNSSVRKSDVLCRFGGDEFAVVMPETTLEDAHRRACEWSADLKLQTIRWQGKLLVPLSLSMGVAAYPNSLTSTELFREADSALYAAKASGRGLVRTSPVFEHRKAM